MVRLYTADWCDNCKTLKKRMDSMGLTYETIDVLREHQAAKALNIRGIPTLIGFDSTGDEVGRLLGSITAPQIKKFYSDMQYFGRPYV